MKFLVCLLFCTGGALLAQNAAPAGDAARGKALFEGKGNCTNCHRVGATGSRVGPDLSELGSQRKPAEIEKSILDPDAQILPENRSFRAVKKSGETVTGRILNQDTFSVQLIDSKEHLVSLQKSNLREWGFIDKSPMPSFRDKLTSPELADVVTYLASLKGIK